MSELRHDPIAGHRVFIAEERAGRPDEFSTVNRAVPREERHCPFCAGNEHETPNPITLLPDLAGTATWGVRIVPNKFPALINRDPDTFVERKQPTTGESHEPRPGFTPVDGGSPIRFLCEPGYGRHEVIIESPRHIERLSDFSAAEIELVLRAYQDCLRRAAGDPRLAYGLVFKNQGPMAGASLAHPHSQFVATPFIPPILAAELGNAAKYFQSHRRCFFCRLRETELAAASRVVAIGRFYTCLTPFASRCAYEMVILPNEHQHRFESLSTGGLGELALFLRSVLIRLARVTGFADFNLCLHTAPFDTDPQDHYHWHLEIIPRISNIAGLEWGGGYYVNAVSPERAAEALRSVT